MRAGHQVFIAAILSGSVAGVLGACSFDAPGELPADGRDADVPDAPDAPPDTMMPDRDTDGDGLLDSADNCPTVPNTDQLDFDGDARGDGCDRCPHLASSTDPDADGDGVGDACDPRPAAADRRAVFVNFARAVPFEGFTELGKMWVAANGRARQPSATDGEGKLRSSTTVTSYAVATRLVAGAATATGFAGLCARTTSGMSFRCCAVTQGPSGSRIVASSQPPPSGGTIYQSFPSIIAAGQTFDLVETVGSGAAGNHCVVTGSGGAGAPTASVDSAGSVDPSTIELYTNSMAAEFAYLFVVASDAP